MDKPTPASVLEGGGIADLFRKAHTFTRDLEAKEAGLYPYFIPIEDSSANTVVIDGQTLIMAGSNNYLGYTHDPRVMEAAADAARRYGTGCTGSRFLNGTLDIHERLEAGLAALCGKDDALVFSTGFQTNLGTISSLVGKNDVVIIDKLDHASIVDGCRLTYGTTKRYKHNDLDELDRVLAATDPRAGRMVAVDGVFSMEGDIAPLPDIVKVAKKHGARLLVDEAHAVGVLGEHGEGAAEETGVLADVDLLVGTFSKSFASIGGYVAGEQRVIDYMKHHARSLIFSASMPPYAVATVQKCLDLMKEEPERRAQVRANADRVRSEFQRMGLDTSLSETPIVPIVTGTMETTFMFWKTLLQAGIFTNPVVPPAVPEGACLIRTSYMATHTEEHLETIVETVRKVARDLGLIG